MSHDEQATHCNGRNRGRRGRDTPEHPLPDDWIRVYDGAVDDGPTGLQCPNCQTDKSIVEYMTRNEETDAIIAQTMRDIALDDELGPPPGGRQTGRDDGRLSRRPEFLSRAPSGQAPTAPHKNVARATSHQA